MVFYFILGIPPEKNITITNAVKALLINALGVIKNITNYETKRLSN